MIGQARYGNLQKYKSRNPIQRALIDRFLEEVSSLVGGLPIRTLLDAGCAEGFVLKQLSQNSPHLMVQGVDVDEAALGRARNFHPTLSFKVADIYRLPFRSDSFDLVLCNQVLEHLADPQQALIELLRVSRAYCLLSVPHEPFFRLANLLRGKSITRLGNDIGHFHNWSEAAFVRLVRPHLEIVTVRKSFPWLIVLGRKAT